MRTISRLITILMILVLGVASPSTTAMGEASGKSGIVMSDMDCCPAGNSPMSDCQKECPYLALCAAKCAPVAMASDFRMLLFQVRISEIGYFQGSDRVGQVIRPPAPPPRIQDMADA